MLINNNNIIIRLEDKSKFLNIKQGATLMKTGEEIAIVSIAKLIAMILKTKKYYKIEASG